MHAVFSMLSYVKRISRQLIRECLRACLLLSVSACAYMQTARDRVQNGGPGTCLRRNCMVKCKVVDVKIDLDLKTDLIDIMASEKVNDTISDNTGIILRALDVLRSKNKGQYIENVAEYCEKEYGWDRPTTMEAIDTAKQKGAVKATMSHGKNALRVVNSKFSTNNDEHTMIHETDMPSQIQAICQDLIDLKRFVHEEIINVKSMVSDKHIASPKRDVNEPDFQKNFIKSHEERIYSLERLSSEKQKVIDKLLEDRSTSSTHEPEPSRAAKANESILIARIAELQSQVEWLKNENKSLVNVNQILHQEIGNLREPTHDPGQKTSHDFIKISRAKNFSPLTAYRAPNRSPNSTTKAQQFRQNDANLNNRFSVLTVEESSNDEPEERDERQSIQSNCTQHKSRISKQSSDAQQNNRKKPSVTILGDSIVKHVEVQRVQQSLQYKQRIYVKNFNGADIQDMNDFAKPIIRKTPDKVILHIGTNEIAKKNKEAEQIAREIYDLAQDIEARNITVAISELTPRADSEQNQVKNAAVNVELGRLCTSGRIPLIKHNNIDATKHLNGSRLHLNNHGTSLLAGNYIKFLRR